MTQPDAEVRDKLRSTYAKNADALITSNQVIATHFATAASGNQLLEEFLMTDVERSEGDFVIDVALLADMFGLSREEIKVRMRDGTITTRCETGVGEDAGCWRLTFHLRDRAYRFIVDGSGNVLTRSTFPNKSRLQDPGGV